MLKRVQYSTGEVLPDGQVNPYQNSSANDTLAINSLEQIAAVFVADDQITPLALPDGSTVYWDAKLPTNLSPGTSVLSAALIPLYAGSLIYGTTIDTAQASATGALGGATDPITLSGQYSWYPPGQTQPFRSERYPLYLDNVVRQPTDPAPPVPLTTSNIGTGAGDVAAGNDARWASVYGVPLAVADGVTDNTAVIQAALTAAGNAGGGVVRLGSGNYFCAGQLTVPPFVILTGPEGCWQTHPQTTSGNWTPARYFDFTHGATLSTIAGAVTFTGAPAVNTGTPFLTIAASACVRNLAIYHPNQSATAATPTSYPWAISLNGIQAAVENVELVNPFQGILASNYSHRHLLRNISGQPLYVGVQTDLCEDVARHENIHWIPNWSYTTGDTNGVGGTFNGPYLWTRANGIAFWYRRSDDQRALNLFSLGYKTGHYFDDGGNGATYGFFTDVGHDFCTNALVVAAVNGGGGGVVFDGFDTFCPTDAAAGTGDNIVSVHLLSSNTGRIGLSNFKIRGTPQYAVIVDGNCPLSLRGGTIDGWDRRSAGGFGIYVNAGFALIADVEANGQGNFIQIAAGVRGVAHDCYGYGGALAINNLAGQTGFPVYNIVGSPTSFFSGGVPTGAVISDGSASRSATVGAFYLGLDGTTYLLRNGSSGINIVSPYGLTLNGSAIGGGGTFPFAGIPYSASSGATPTAATGAQIADSLAGTNIVPARVGYDDSNNPAANLPALAAKSLVMGGYIADLGGFSYWDFGNSLGQGRIMHMSTALTIGWNASSIYSVPTASIGSDGTAINITGGLSASAIPTSDPHVAGRFWQDPSTHALYVSQG